MILTVAKYEVPGSHNHIILRSYRRLTPGTAATIDKIISSLDPSDSTDDNESQQLLL